METVLELLHAAPHTTLARPKGSRRPPVRGRRPRPDRPPMGPEATVELPKTPSAPPEPVRSPVPIERAPATDDRRGLRL